MCRPKGRRLLLFESLDSMVRSWGAVGTREFFMRCCPLLLDAGAIAYWTMSARDTPAVVQETVRAVANCMLHVDERSVRMVKAEGRNGAVRGAVLHWHEQAGRPVLAPPEVVGRITARCAAVRSARNLSQHDLGGLAGVTASAISQAERAERGLLAGDAGEAERRAGRHDRRPAARGRRRGVYRLGRRTDDPQARLRAHADAARRRRLRRAVDLVHLGARGPPRRRPSATGRRRSSPSPAAWSRSRSRTKPRRSARRGPRRRQRADPGMARPRPGRGDDVLDRVTRIQAVTRLSACRARAARLVQLLGLEAVRPARARSAPPGSRSGWSRRGTPRARSPAYASLRGHHGRGRDVHDVAPALLVLDRRDGVDHVAVPPHGVAGLHVGDAGDGLARAAGATARDGEGLVGADAAHLVVGDVVEQRRSIR